MLQAEPEFSVIGRDVTNGDEDGVGLTCEISQLYPSVHVLIVTT